MPADVSGVYTRLVGYKSYLALDVGSDEAREALTTLQRRLLDVGDAQVVVARTAGGAETNWYLPARDLSSGHLSDFHPVYVDVEGFVFVIVRRDDAPHRYHTKHVSAQDFWSLNGHLADAVNGKM